MDDALAEIDRRLAGLSARLRAWNAPLDVLIQEALRRGSPGEGLEAAKRLEEERSREGKGVPQEIRKALGELAEAWLQGPPERRRRLRGLLEGKDNLRDHLYGFIGVSSGWIALKPDRRVLERALAAAAIEGGRMDSRDLLMALGGVWRVAEKAGLHPGPVFQEVAALADGESRGLLAGFEASAYLASIRYRG